MNLHHRKKSIKFPKIEMRAIVEQLTLLTVKKAITNYMKGDRCGKLRFKPS